MQNDKPQTTNHQRLYCLLLAVFLLSSCEPQFDTPEPSAGTADFTRYVAIGSSYSSGFSDGALSKQGQRASFPNLLAQQMRLVGGADTFNISLLKGDKGCYPSDTYAPGDFKLTEPKLTLVKKPDCKGEVKLLPERLPGLGDDELDLDDDSQRDTSHSVFHHLGIPAMKMIDVTSPGYGDVANYGTSKSFSPYFWRFAPQPLFLSSPYTYVTAIRPTFYTMELGMSDVLAYGIAGGASNDYEDQISSVNSFRLSLKFMLDDLLAQGAQGVIANIPDVTTFPYFTTIIYDSLNLAPAEADSMNALYGSNPNVGAIFHAGSHNPFVVKEDGIVRTIKSNEFVHLGIDVDSLKCMHLGSYIPIGDKDVLSETEIARVRSFTAQFNTVIEEEAAARGIAVVDLAAFMQRISDETTISGIDFSAEMVSGAFFSLDGLHPTNRGQAMLANEFIKTINRTFSANLPELIIADYQGILFP